MSKKNEYDEIYLQDSNTGMEYTYKHHRLGGEKFIPSEELSKIGAFKCNEDRVFIRCGECDIYMNFAHRPVEVGNGKWFCPKCGTFVKETTVNRYIGEIKPMIDEDNDDYDEYY